MEVQLSTVLYPRLGCFWVTTSLPFWRARVTTMVPEYHVGR